MEPMATPLAMPSTLEIHGDSQPQRKLAYRGTSAKISFAATKPPTTVRPAEIQVERFSSCEGLSPIFLMVA